MRRTPEIPDIHGTTQTSISDYQLQISRLRTDILRFRSLMFGKWDTASDEKYYRGRVPRRHAGGEPPPVTHRLRALSGAV